MVTEPPIIRKYFSYRFITLRVRSALFAHNTPDRVCSGFAILFISLLWSGSTSLLCSGVLEDAHAS